MNILQNTHTGSQIRSQPVPKIGIIPCTVSDHSALKFEMNHKRKFGRNTNTWKLKNEWINQEIKEELKKSSWKQMKMKIQLFQTFGIQQRQFYEGSV